MINLPPSSPVAVVASPSRQSAAGLVGRVLRAVQSGGKFEVHRWTLTDDTSRRPLAADIAYRRCRHLVSLTDAKTAVAIVDEIDAIAPSLIGWVHADPLTPKGRALCELAAALLGTHFLEAPVPADAQDLPASASIASLDSWLQTIDIADHLLLAEHWQEIQRWMGQ